MEATKEILRGKNITKLIKAKTDLFFSLVDYRNNLYTSDDPKKIIEFYDSFENKEQLIQWMKERPKGVAYIHEVKGIKDIIVVIPTADFNGKYARTCRDEIFKGLYIIFIESGDIPDPYFNYAHNVNVGIKKAMEYNPKWIIVSNDDMVKIDGVNKLISELNNMSFSDTIMVLRKSTNDFLNIAKIASSKLLRNFMYKIVTSYTRNVIRLEKKFKINYLLSALTFPNKLLFKPKMSISAFNDFVIFNISLLHIFPQLFDEAFINGGEDIYFSLQIYSNKYLCKTIDYGIGSIIGGTLGKKGRMLKDIANLTYLNAKIEEMDIFNRKKFNK